MYPEQVKQFPTDPRSVRVFATFTIDPYTGLPVTGGGGGGGTTYDYEMRTIEYLATANGTGFSTNDRLVLTDVVNVLVVPAVVVSTMWFNATTLTQLSAAPPASSITMISPGGGGGTVGGSLEATQLLVKAGVDAINTVLGARADAAATSDTGSFSIVALVKRGLAHLATLIDRTPVLGKKAAADSVPVTLASNEALPLPAGASTSALQTTSNTLLTTIADKLPATPATAVGQVAILDKITPNASTAALQTAGNTTLGTVATTVASVDTKTPALVGGNTPVLARGQYLPTRTDLTPGDYATPALGILGQTIVEVGLYQGAGQPMATLVQPLTNDQLRATPLVVSQTDLPVGFDNLPRAFAYDGDGEVSTVTVTNGSSTWVQTWSWATGKLTSVSGWVLQ